MPDDSSDSAVYASGMSRGTHDVGGGAHGASAGSAAGQVGAAILRTEGKCAICLSSFDDVAFLSECYHRFCFLCILQWYSFNKQCPLCKREYESIIHNLTDEWTFDVFSPREERRDVFDRYRRQVRARTVTQSQSERHVAQYNSRFGKRRRADVSGGVSVSPRRQRQQVYFAGWAATHTYAQTLVRDIKREARDDHEWNDHVLPFVVRDFAVILDGVDVAVIVHVLRAALQRFAFSDDKLHGEMEPFLGVFTDVFLHELQFYCSQRLNMKTFDQRIRERLVQLRRRLADLDHRIDTERAALERLLSAGE